MRRFLLSTCLIFLLGIAVFGILHELAKLPSVSPRFANRAVLPGECQTTIEGIILALSGKHNKQSQADFSGHKNLLSSLTATNCYEGRFSKRKTASEADLHAFRNAVEKTVSTLPEKTPHRLTGAIEIVNGVSRHSGIWRYFACDYALRREPNLTYAIASRYVDLHRNEKRLRRRDRVWARIKECGVEHELQQEAQKRLASSNFPKVEFK